MNEKKYHQLSSCPKCGNNTNEVEQVHQTDGGYISECTTKCTGCGWEDYWAYGFYESSTEMIVNCEKY